MLIKLIIYGLLFYFGYYVFQSFKALRKAAEQSVKRSNSAGEKKSAINKNDIEDLDYEEVEKK